MWAASCRRCAALRYPNARSHGAKRLSQDGPGQFKYKTHCASWEQCLVSLDRSGCGGSPWLVPRKLCLWRGRVDLRIPLQRMGAFSSMNAAFLCACFLAAVWWQSDGVWDTSWDWPPLTPSVTSTAQTLHLRSLCLLYVPVCGQNRDNQETSRRDFQSLIWFFLFLWEFLPKSTLIPLFTQELL